MSTLEPLLFVRNQWPLQLPLKEFAYDRCGATEQFLLWLTLREEIKRKGGVNIFFGIVSHFCMCWVVVKGLNWLLFNCVQGTVQHSERSKWSFLCRYTGDPPKYIAFFNRKNEAHCWVLAFCPNVALLVAQTRCQSFRINRYLLQRLCAIFWNFLW